MPCVYFSFSCSGVVLSPVMKGVSLLGVRGSQISVLFDEHFHIAFSKKYNLSSMYIVLV